MIDLPLLKYMHPAMVYRRTPLTDEENGLALLRAAGEAVVNENDEIGHLYYADEDCECGLPDCLACNYDYATIMRMLARVLEKNSRSLELYSQVLAKGRVQFPVPRNAPWFGGSESDLSFDLQRLKGLEAPWACERGDLPDAARSVCERAQMAAIVGRGEGTLGDYIMFGIGGSQGALRAAIALVDNPLADRRTLDELARIQAFALDDEDLAQAVRADFQISIDAIEEVNRATPLTERIDQLLGFYAQKPLMVESEAWDDEGRVAERRRQLQFILEGHPLAWDAAETVRELSQRTERNTRHDWQSSEVGEQRGAELWQHLPPQLRPHFPIECFGESFSAVAARATARDYDAEWEYESLSDEDLAAARDTIRTINNPIGILVQEVLRPTDIRYLHEEFQEMVRTLTEKIRERSESR